jgi:hypothetical protein
MNEIRYVAFGGQFGTGKDTAADYLAEQLNYEARELYDQKRWTELEKARRPIVVDDNGPAVWQRSAFADAVKSVFMDAFGEHKEFIEKWKRIPEPPEGYLKNIRQALQFIGDGFRQIKPDIWIEIAFRGYNPRKVFADCRYFNEARCVSEHGGINVLMWRPGYENDDPNPSEAQLKPCVDWCVSTNQRGIIDLSLGENPPEEMKWFDIFLRNDGSPEDLYKKIDEIVIPYMEN